MFFMFFKSYKCYQIAQRITYCETPEFFGSFDDIVDFSALIKNKRNITMLRSPDQAKELFITLIQNFDSVWNVVLYKFILVC